MNCFLSPSPVGIIDDIVMNETGGMNRFNQSPHKDMIRSPVIEKIGAEKQKCGTHALSGFFENIVSDFGNQGIGMPAEALQFMFNFL